MIFSEYGKFDALGLAELVRRGEVSPQDLLDSALDAIERLNPTLNCVVQRLPAHGRSQIKRGLPYGPFRGVPFLIKEMGMHFKGMPTTGGSRLAAGLIFPDETELMRRCDAAGLVSIGTTAMPEFGFNASSEAVVYGPTRNPWNTEYSAGGSSGGAGAAVASGMVPIAHANDGGGSIRIPAACNGLVGMKPSRGRTPIGPGMGMFLWGNGIEHAVSRTVRDSAALLDCLHGPDDGYYEMAAPPRRGFLAAAMTPPGTLRIGVVETLPGARRTAPEQKARLHDTRRLLEELGHVCEPVALAYDVDVFDRSSLRLFAVTLGHFLEQFAAATGRKIGPRTCEAVTLEMYRYARSMKALEMEQAMLDQNAISRAVGAVMRRYDVLLTPGLVRDVARLGELNQNARGVGVLDWWRQIMHDYSAFTPLFNTTGQPALMLPLWQAKSGLPLGMQFVGRLGDEETLYSLGGQLEQALPWHARMAPCHA